MLIDKNFLFFFINIIDRKKSNIVRYMTLQIHKLKFLLYDCVFLPCHLRVSEWIYTL